MERTLHTPSSVEGTTNINHYPSPLQGKDMIEAKVEREEVLKSLRAISFTEEMLHSPRCLTLPHLALSHPLLPSCSSHYLNLSCNTYSLEQLHISDLTPERSYFLELLYLPF
jgi:hypothetical protein